MIDNFWIQNISKKYGFSILPGVSKRLLKMFQEEYFSLPDELQDFYLLTNGLFGAEFTILPIFDPNNRKKTWDSLNKANTANEYLPYDHTFLEGNCVFARLTGLDFTFFDKTTKIIYVARRSAKKENFSCFEIFKTNTSTFQDFVNSILAEHESNDDEI